jgi:hypothetical protein
VEDPDSEYKWFGLVRSGYISTELYNWEEKIPWKFQKREPDTLLAETDENDGVYVAKWFEAD